MTSHPILLMTGVDLYRIVADVIDGKKEAAEQIDLLFETVGVIDYSSE